MIWRIRARDEFARLTEQGVRRRSGVLWCTYLLDPTAVHPRVAFAIGRGFGPAVARNRARRRLRALLAASPPPPGWYLFGAAPTIAERSSTELAADLARLLDAAHRAVPLCG